MLYDLPNWLLGLVISGGGVATINSLLLAFSTVSVWESFDSAEEAVVHEADTIGELARDLAVFDSEASRRARTMLRQYARLVVDEEWTDMRPGGANVDAWRTVDNLFRRARVLHSSSRWDDETR